MGYIVWGVIIGGFGLISRDNVASVLGMTDAAKILTTTVWIVIIMDMVMTFEDEFGVEIDTEAIGDLKTIGSVVTYIEQKDSKH